MFGAFLLMLLYSSFKYYTILIKFVILLYVEKILQVKELSILILPIRIESNADRDYFNQYKWAII